MRISGPKLLLHCEGLLVLAAACLLYRHLGASWGKFALWFLAPDLTMLGYLSGLKAGALLYNAGHTYLAPSLLWAVATEAHAPWLIPFGVIWAAHIGFDRMLGYGLKYPTAFKDTHLSRV